MGIFYLHLLFHWRRNMRLVYVSFLLESLLFTAEMVKDLKDFHVSLTAEELKEVFGVDRHAEVPDYHVFVPHTSLTVYSTHSTSGHVQAALSTENDRFELNLRPRLRDMLSPDIVTIIRDGPKSKRLDGRLNVDSDCHFVGEVLSHANASVALSNCHHLRGTIILDDHSLLFHPLPMRYSDVGQSKRSDSPLEDHKILTPHVIYKRASGLKPMPKEDIPLQYTFERPGFKEFCGVEFNYTAPEIADINSYHIFKSLDPLTIEIALFLDSKLWEHFNKEFEPDRSEKELTDFALAVINSTELASDLHKNGQAALLLKAFCDYQSRINPGTDTTDPAHWDHAVILTGYDIYLTNSGVSGLANVARMCDHLYSCTLVEGFHLGGSFILAHEMGHNLGMAHDGDQNLCLSTCCLMSAITGAGKTTWSSCSVTELNTYIGSLGNPGSPPNCLADSGIGHPTWIHDKDKRLPGQRFTADQQCSFVYGRDYKQVTPTGGKQAGICHILWCGNGGSRIFTAHPALPGTWCGNKSWCSDGQCKPWPISEQPSLVDGSWSSWSQLPASKCSDCSISGGIRLRMELRNCDNPAPNNGGKTCGGASIRGIVCDSSVLQCGAFNTSSYGNSVCKSFKNNISNPDKQLDGRTYLNPSDPCKVWCHLVTPKLITRKDKYPDGTSCGLSRHCVSGECMDLTCGDLKAVVDNHLDCPANEPPFPVTTLWISHPFTAIIQQTLDNEQGDNTVVLIVITILILALLGVLALWYKSSRNKFVEEDLEEVSAAPLNEVASGCEPTEVETRSVGSFGK